jgi:methyl-accepting chemotaxis protein
VWNAANCRNRRFFKDSAGLRAPSSSKPTTDTWARDMGYGTVVTLKEVDAPIRIHGRH